MSFTIQTIPAKKSAALDVEPVYTFRAHKGNYVINAKLQLEMDKKGLDTAYMVLTAQLLSLGPVLSLAVAPDGDYCFSGGIDTTIRCWNMPHSTVDPYDSYGKI